MCQYLYIMTNQSSYFIFLNFPYVYFYCRILSRRLNYIYSCWLLNLPLLWLGPFLRHSLFLITLTVLRNNISYVFCKMSLN